MLSGNYLGPQLQNLPYERVNVFSLPVSKVAAGADLSFTVPNGVLWDVVSLLGTFTASAGVANRQVGFFVKDQTGTAVYQYQMTTSVTASLVVTFCFSEETGTAPTAAATGNQLLMPQPTALYPGGWSFGTVTTNIQAGDQWSSVACWVQEYLPPADN